MTRVISQLNKWVLTQLNRLQQCSQVVSVHSLSRFLQINVCACKLIIKWYYSLSICFCIVMIMNNRLLQRRSRFAVILLRKISSQVTSRWFKVSCCFPLEANACLNSLQSHVHTDPLMMSCSDQEISTDPLTCESDREAIGPVYAGSLGLECMWTVFQNTQLLCRTIFEVLKAHCVRFGSI